jgi:hypothetical protein
MSTHDDGTFSGSDTTVSPINTFPPRGHAISHSGRNIQSLSVVRMETNGNSRGTTHSKVAPLKSSIKSQPRPRKRKASDRTPTILPSISNISTFPVWPEIRTMEDWCINWVLNNRKASDDERSFVILLKSYGLEMATAVAKEQGWKCERLIRETEALSF